jgi:dolichol-phosphate mannosyltransferase
MRVLVWIVIIVQLALALRFFARVKDTVGGERISGPAQPATGARYIVVVPVLNEIDRLAPCLRGLVSHGPRLVAIIVVDGGSTDGTPELVLSYRAKDSRVRLIELDSIPDGWNGKAWGLEVGRRAAADRCEWVVTSDADVRCRSGAVDTVVDFAESRSVNVLSIACEQSAQSTGLSLVHPSLLSTLVYRFGVPGSMASGVAGVQSNGQFAAYRRDTLDRAGGFSAARDSICEDVTLARHMHLLGEEVGFYEAPGLATTEMYPSAMECVRNWPRSLPLTDRIAPMSGVNGLANILFLQVLPLVLVWWSPSGGMASRLLHNLNRFLLGTRLGALIGTRRAYSEARFSYWLSPLFDPVTAILYIASMWKRNHMWRGRRLVQDWNPEHGSITEGGVRG